MRREILHISREIHQPISTDVFLSVSLSSALSRPMVLKMSQSWTGSAKNVKLLRDG